MSDPFIPLLNLSGYPLHSKHKPDLFPWSRRSSCSIFVFTFYPSCCCLCSSQMSLLPVPSIRSSSPITGPLCSAFLPVGWLPGLWHGSGLMNSHTKRTSPLPTVLGLYHVTCGLLSQRLSHSVTVSCIYLHLDYFAP